MHYNPGHSAHEEILGGKKGPERLGLNANVVANMQMRWIGKAGYKKMK